MGIYPLSFTQMVFKTKPKSIASTVWMSPNGVDGHSSYFLDYGNGKTMLVIEDDIEFANVLVNFFHKYGYRGIVAPDGETGIRRVIEQKPTAVILDIGLPGIDGWAVLNELKNNPDTRHLPVYIICAADNIREGLQKGAVGYLTKPVTNLDLMPLIWTVAGAGVGIVSFAQVLGWLFKRFHDVTVAVLIGMLVGSLRKLWPWKEALETMIDRHGKVVPIAERNILPPALTWEVGATVLLAVLGFVLIWQLTAWAERREKAE